MTASTISPARPTFDRVELKIASHFASPIIDGDTSGLSDREDREVDRFVAWITEGREGGHFELMTGEPDFMHCTVCDQLAECVTITYWFPIAEKAA